jgi:hypothetical protein
MVCHDALGEGALEAGALEAKVIHAPQSPYHAVLQTDNLRVLNITGRVGATDYIDFIDPQEMCESKMAFLDDFRRPGFVLRLYQKGQPEKLYTFAAFQRYTNNARNWSYGWGHSDATLEHAMYEYHRRLEMESPFQNMAMEPAVLRAILNGTHPIVGCA